MATLDKRLNHDPKSIDKSQPVEPAALATDMASPWLGFGSQAHFFENDELASVMQRGLFYARAGVPIHFKGTAGRGKTAIALEIARRLGRPVSVMTGHEWLDAGDLVGKRVGQTNTTLVDRYVQHVRRSEATTRYDWENSLLALAMMQGHTLVYDEFTRANAKANGILLSVLEEGVLIASDPLAPKEAIQAHPQFRIILTSNPLDYSGVNASPDALLDRMVTFDIPRFSATTEIGIVSTRTGISAELSHDIVQLVHAIVAGHPHEAGKTTSSMRAAIMIARIAAMRLRDHVLSDALLAQITSDVLSGRGVRISTAEVAKHLKLTGRKGATP